MSKDANVATQQRMAQAVNSGRLNDLDDIFGPHIVDHDPAPDQGPGAQGFKDFFTALRTAFPDLKIEPEHMVTDDDNVCFAYTISGTHQGAFLGLAPTGKHVKVRGMQIGRFENGKMVERWGSSDELGIVRQLGATVQPS